MFTEQDQCQIGEQKYKRQAQNFVHLERKDSLFSIYVHTISDGMNPKCVLSLDMCLYHFLYTNRTDLYNYNESFTVFSRLCMQILSSNELWMHAPIAFNGMDEEINLDISQAQQSAVKLA